MTITETAIPDLLLIQPRVFEDERGYFYESYNKNTLQQLGLEMTFVQDNQSLSQKGVLRGLHFQNPPHAQGKLVRVIQGSVLDVAVDVRIDSSTYGQHVSVILSSENKSLFWIPPGFAHGFLTLENNTLFSYKCTDIYHPESEEAILWDDSTLAIDWGEKNPIVSDKDQKGIAFNQFKSQF